MTTFIATLQGDTPFSRRTPSYTRRYTGNRVNTELMGGLMAALGSMGKSVLRVVSAPVTGLTHAVMETGRGIATGDVKRIIKAPFKGTGHVIGEAFRGTKEHAEYYWRPSKMSQWMGPAGAGLSAAAPFTGPAAPFLLAGGAALTAGGAISSKIYATGLERDAARAASSPEAVAARKRVADVKKRNYIYMAAGGAALIGAIALMA